MNGNISMVGGITSANVIVTTNGKNYSCAISASNHTYAMGTWTTANANSDKVTIVNNSNVPVNANIVYNDDSGYSSTVI